MVLEIYRKFIWYRVLSKVVIRNENPGQISNPGTH